MQLSSLHWIGLCGVVIVALHGVLLIVTVVMMMVVAVIIMLVLWWVGASDGGDRWDCEYGVQWVVLMLVRVEC